MEWLGYVVGVAFVFWVMNLGFDVIKWVLMGLAVRLFGWRPSIYDEALAKSIAEVKVKEICRAQEEAGYPVGNVEQAILEDFGPWMIENYTMHYAAKRK